MAIAWLGMTPKEFFECRVGHYFSALQYYQEGKNRDVRLISELIRRQTVDLLNIQMKKSDRLKPEQLWRYPWDAEEEKITDMTDEEIKAYNDEIIKRLTNG